MFADFTVKDFRCFRQLKLSNLARVNLIAGKNNTGKTALLEAIHLHNQPNEAGFALAINKIRGIEDPGKAFEDVLAWLFFHGHAESGLVLASQDAQGVSRTTSIWVMDPWAARERFPEAEPLFQRLLPAAVSGPSGPSPSLSPGLFRGSKWLVLKADVTNEPPRFSVSASGIGITSVSSHGLRSIPSVFVPSTSVATSTEQDTRYFGEVEADKRQAQVLPALQILEPRLKRLALVPLAGEVIIHGDLEGLPRLVPISFMGEGVRRVLSIVLAVANARDGVVLIDEIENGLHYSIQEKVWAAVADAARRANVQVVATTHSWECIEAAHRAFKTSPPYELRLFRLDRRGDEVTAKTFDERLLDAVERTDLEAR